MIPGGFRIEDREAVRAILQLEREQKLRKSRHLAGLETGLDGEHPLSGSALPGVGMNGDLLKK